MTTTGRVTITLPAELVEEIDRIERNRSRFIAGAVARELARLRRQALHRSLRRPHPETASVAEEGLADWGASLPAGDDGLVDGRAGMGVRWVEGRGWVEEPS